MEEKPKRISEEDVRKNVEKKFKARDVFFRSAFTYLAVNILLWAIWFITRQSFPWPLFVTFFWGIGMLSQGVDYYNRYGKGARNRESAIEAEVVRQLDSARAQEALQGRRMNKHAVEKGADVYELENVQQRGLRLADDGELVDFEHWDDEDVAEKRESP